MAEQLSMFTSAPIAEPPVTEIPQEPEYEALDYQLADLMIELNDFTPEDEKTKKELNETLRYCTLEISKRTREGQIAMRISPNQQSIILKATVTGEAGDYIPLIVNQGHLYLNRYWQYQQRLANQINARIASKQEPSETQHSSIQQWAQTRLDEYFKTNHTSDEINWQKRAAELALENKFLIVSGGPGTGKTTTITRLLTLLIEQQLQSLDQDDQIQKHVEKDTPPLLRVSSNKLKILLAAPTGKAAVRMLGSMRDASNALQTELSLDDLVLGQLPTEANTIHKLLGYKHNSTQFKHNKNNLLSADVVLVDEASMIDIALMSKLVDAVPEHAKLILIGDKDQLASVETGSVFADICEGLANSNNTVTSLVTLRKNYRFDANSDIGQCAIAANLGESKSLLSVLNDPNRSNAELIAPVKLRDADLIKPWLHYLKVLNNPESTVAEIFDAFNQYRILNALRRGFNGSESMNNRIETALEKQGSIKRRRGGSSQNKSQQSNWYHGRPIMITQNSYNRGLFNGDTGITLIRDGEIKVYFPSASNNEETNEFKSFSPIRLPVHETTWAMTIHKSQGSEFNQVVLILPPEEMPLLTRQLIYTGITRARDSVIIVASEEVLVAGVKAEVVKATRVDQYLEMS